METILSIGDCIGADELTARIDLGKQIIAYNGFEPSGQMTFAQCMTAVINVNKITQQIPNCTFIFWVADVFAELNNKLGRDMRKIRKAGELMIEIWKAAGMDMSKVKFLWASDEINKNPTKYYKLVNDISSSFTISRIKRCIPALGRESSDELTLSTLNYAVMQCADIFYLNVDICQMGNDQLKINMLAREFCDKTKYKKPIIVSHKILGGLDGKDKMSKSNPDTAIFMTDSVSDINRKIKRAWCEEGNPTGSLFDICENIILQLAPLTVKNTSGEFSTYTKINDLRSDFAAKIIHPGDLKPVIAARINEIIEPIRLHFTTGESAQLLKTVSKYKLTK
ncbi:tyrosine-tRNA ligase [Pacmanvirus S19]|nr:tyrosine-tRNA ligase [Pacmanvirus S19]